MLTKEFWRSVLAVLVGLFIWGIISWILWVVLLVNFSITASGKEMIKPRSVLIISLDKPIEDHVVQPVTLTSLLNRKQPLGLSQIIKSIQYASTDPKIQGILLDTRIILADWAQLEEIRKALQEFKSSGKFVVAYSNFYTHRNYYLSSIADRIYLEPSGVFMWKGLSSQVLFYKKLLDKLGIKAILIRHGKYKTAGEPFVRESLSEPNREQLQLLLDRFWDQIVQQVAQARSLRPEYLDSLADNLSIRVDTDAVHFGLVDTLLYYDQVLDTLKSLVGIPQSHKLNTVTLESYYSSQIKPIQIRRANKIAVVYAQGNIVDQASSVSGKQIVGKKLARRIRSLRERSDIKAIVLRVNSPGGSALASEEIWREVYLTAQQKPVIVSMGGVAASGGYYISTAATKIVADSFTITGSIGVFGLFLNAQNLLENKLGITYDFLSTNKNAVINPVMKDLTPDQENYLREQIDYVYQTFLQRVAQGRNMSIENVDSIAQGRVWSAIDARRLGLVDTLGDLQLAIDLAVQESGVLEYSLEEYPRSKTLLELLLNPSGVGDVNSELLRQLRELEMYLSQQGVMVMMPYRIEIY